MFLAYTSSPLFAPKSPMIPRLFLTRSRPDRAQQQTRRGARAGTPPASPRPCPSPGAEPPGPRVRGTTGQWQAAEMGRLRWPAPRREDDADWAALLAAIEAADQRGEIYEVADLADEWADRKSKRLNSSHKC